MVYVKWITKVQRAGLVRLRAWTADTGCKTRIKKHCFTVIPIKKRLKEEYLLCFMLKAGVGHILLVFFKSDSRKSLNLWQSGHLLIKGPWFGKVLYSIIMQLFRKNRDFTWLFHFATNKWGHWQVYRSFDFRLASQNRTPHTYIYRTTW